MLAKAQSQRFKPFKSAKNNPHENILLSSATLRRQLILTTCARCHFMCEILLKAPALLPVLENTKKVDAEINLPEEQGFTET